MGTAVKTDMSFVVPKDIGIKLVECNDYLPVCKLGYKLKVSGLVFTALEYENIELAKISAKRLDTFYSRNWVFDDVMDEPILKRFVQNAFKAQKFQAQSSL